MQINLLIPRYLLSHDLHVQLCADLSLQRMLINLLTRRLSDEQILFGWPKQRHLMTGAAVAGSMSVEYGPASTRRSQSDFVQSKRGGKFVSVIAAR